MQKTPILLIIVMLLHGLFTCADAVSHVESSEHSFDYAYETDYEHAGSQLTVDHEDQFHAHVSCLTGYPEVTHSLHFSPLRYESPLTASINNVYQPPVPPPDMNSLA